MKLPVILLLACLPFTANAEEKLQLLGNDFENWTFVTKEGEKPAETAWKLADGVLSTTGEPIGYLRTKESYKNYTLNVEWRWLPGTGENNSGVLVHVSTPGAAGVWPKSFESQLMQGNAGDFWTIGEKLEATGENKGGRWIRIADPGEKPLGEWNTMTVKCTADEIVVHVNGVLVNSGKNLSINEGAIAFQSEGKPIEIRKVTVTR
jgi:hypothetical protein